MKKQEKILLKKLAPRFFKALILYLNVLEHPKDNLAPKKSIDKSQS